MTPEQLAAIINQPGYGIDASATAVLNAPELPAILAKSARSEFLAILGANVPITCEADMQEAIFACAKALAPDYPDLAGMYAIPNQLVNGRRPVPGQLAGMPDICLPVSRGDGINTYLTLYIELKMPGKYPRPEQRERHEWLRSRGHAVEVCKSVTATVDLLRAYLDGQYVPF